MTAIVRVQPGEDGAQQAQAASYTVAEGTQVNLAGVVHEGGSNVVVDALTAAEWLRAGYLIDPLPNKLPKRQSKAPSAS